MEVTKVKGGEKSEKKHAKKINATWNSHNRTSNRIINNGFIIRHRYDWHMD